VPNDVLEFAVHNVPPMLLLGPCLLAAGLYLLLRWVVRAPAGGITPETVSRHSLWIGVIGWLASSLQSAGNAGILPAGSSSPQLGAPAGIMAALMWPILGCLAVHAIGQLSYPGRQLPRRHAAPVMRRVRDYLPRSLAWTVLAIFATSALQIAWVATLPGYEAIPFGALEERHHGFSRLGGDGRIPGHVLAACLGAGWAALAFGTILVLLLISRRRQLEALGVAENDLLRSIAMNRLLRTVATVAAGLAAIAGNYAARPDPAANVASWTNPAGFAAFLVLLAMWGWAPPKLTRAETPRMGPALGESPAAAHPATRLSVSLGAAMGLAPLAAGVLGFFFPGAGLREQPAILAALMAAAVLLVAAGGELLLQRNYGSPGVPATWPRQAVSPALRTTAIIAVVLFTTVTVMTAAGEMRLSQAGLEASGSWLAAVSATLAVAAIAALPVAAARTRRGIATGVPGLDAALRAITLHRVARTLAASVAAQSGILLITASNTWPPLLGLPLAQSSWQPAVIAGAALTAAGVVIAVIPIRRFARVPATAPSVREGAR
jgi:hypothetical protein